MTARPAEVTAVDDTAPHRSDDPSYCDTWYWNMVDPVRRCVVTMHCAWSPSRRTGQHTVGLITPDSQLLETVETASPFESAIASIDILEPWERARVSSALGFEVTWEAFHPPIDMHRAVRVEGAIDQRHFQGGGRVSGVVHGRRVDGSGFRDRSFGPRDFRGIGQHWIVCLEGIDRDVFVTCNAMVASGRAYDAAPDHSTCCVLDGDGPERHYDGRALLRRGIDARATGLVLPNQWTVEFDAPAIPIGDQRHVLEPQSRLGATGRGVPRSYGIRDYYVTGTSPELGPLVGFYEEGVLWLG